MASYPTRQSSSSSRTRCRTRTHPWLPNQMPSKSQYEPSAMSSLALSERSAVSLGRRTGRVMRSHSLQQEEGAGTVPKLLVSGVERRATSALSAPRKRKKSKKQRHRRGPLMARFTGPGGALQWACQRGSVEYWSPEDATEEILLFIVTLISFETD